MSEQVRGLGGAAARGRTATGLPVAESDGGPFPGRHENGAQVAAETPIFHALTVGGWRSRQQEPVAPATGQARPVALIDPLTAFRRDPLTAPIPVQALASASVPEQPIELTRHSGRDGTRDIPEQTGGRHRRLSPVRNIGC